MSKKSKKLSFEEHWNNQAEVWAEGIRGGKDVFRDLFSLPAFVEFIGDKLVLGKLKKLMHQASLM